MSLNNTESLKKYLETCNVITYNGTIIILLFMVINMTSRIRRRVIVTGRVQGVAFRAYSRSAARKIGVVGWVRNLPDGSVETVVEGDPERVTLMLAWLKRGAPQSRVDDLVIVEEKPTGEFADFDITFDGWESWRV